MLESGSYVQQSRHVKKRREHRMNFKTSGRSFLSVAEGQSSCNWYYNSIYIQNYPDSHHDNLSLKSFSRVFPTHPAVNRSVWSWIESNHELSKRDRFKVYSSRFIDGDFMDLISEFRKFILPILYVIMMSPSLCKGMFFSRLSCCDHR